MTANPEYGPAPKTIGIGPMKITAPAPKDEEPRKTETIVMRVIPVTIREKPKTKSLNGVVAHRETSETFFNV
jgi:hypothetical protein